MTLVTPLIARAHWRRNRGGMVERQGDISEVWEELAHDEGGTIVFLVLESCLRGALGIRPGGT